MDDRSNYQSLVRSAHGVLRKLFRHASVWFGKRVVSFQHIVHNSATANEFRQICLCVCAGADAVRPFFLRILASCNQGTGLFERGSLECTEALAV